MMSSVDKFLHDLVHFDKEHIAPKVIDALQVYLKVYAVSHCVNKKHNEMFLLAAE